jgi:hypothetical protein
VNKISSTRIQLFLNMRHNTTSWDLLTLLNFTYSVRCLFVIQIIFPRMVGNTVNVCVKTVCSDLVLQASLFTRL